MKINILTQPLFCNYGGILQNFALQRKLTSMGHDVLTVNVPIIVTTRYRGWKNFAYSIINFVRRMNGSYRAPFLNPAKQRLMESVLSFPQREFLANYIKKVDEYAPFSEDVCKMYPADAWIVGSDQVWRPFYSPSITNCFFDFIKEDGVRRIAYAASFGTDYWEADVQTTEQLRVLAAKFNAISVRESSGVKLCKEYLGVDAQHVLDPTLLLTAEDYFALVDNISSPTQPYIAEYVLDMNRTKTKTIRFESKRQCLPVQSIGVMRSYRFDSVEEWISAIAHSECVITDSFHGTVFSLIFRRPVKILTNNIRGNARIESLLAMLRLTPDADGFYHVTEDVIDRIGFLQQEAQEFLHNALSK